MQPTRKIYLPIAFLLMCTGCKTRKVATIKTDFTTTVHTVNTSKKDVVSIDTGKIHSELKIVKNTRDSDEIDITPDSGSIQKIKISGSSTFAYSGAAKSIVFKKHVDSQTTLAHVIQNNKGLVTHVTEADSASKNESTKQVSKTKTTYAKSNNIWVPVILTIIAVIGIIGYCVFKHITG